MKLKLALAAGFLAGAAAVVIAVVSLTGKSPLPTVAEVNAAEPGKGDEPAKGADYSYLYERTKPRTVVGGLPEKYYGSPEGKYLDGAAAEYDIQALAARTRSGGKDVYLVGIRKQYTKIEGAKTMPDPSTYFVGPGDAASALRFLDKMKDAKKSGSAEVALAEAVWMCNSRDMFGQPTQASVTRLTAKYDGKVVFSGWYAEPTWLNGDTANFAKVLAEGLKEVEAFKKAEWSPLP